MGYSRIIYIIYRCSPSHHVTFFILFFTDFYVLSNSMSSIGDFIFKEFYLVWLENNRDIILFLGTFGFFYKYRLFSVNLIETSSCS
jgi:hypothetical protein